MTKCTPEVKARILTLTSLGFTPKEVSKKLHLDPSTVRHNLARLYIHPDITTTTPHPERPRLIDNRSLHRTVLTLRRGFARDAIDLQQQFFPKVHPRPV